MSTPKSYDLNQFDLDQETRRLRTQALLTWAQESRILVETASQLLIIVIAIAACGQKG